MTWQTVVLIIAGLAFCGFLIFIGFLYMVKRAASKAIGGVVNKAINKTGEVIGDKVIAPTMDVATGGMKKGIDAVGTVVKDGFEEKQRTEPKRLQVAVAKLAEKSHGLVTEASAMAELKITAVQAKTALKTLEKEGACKTRVEDQAKTYVFDAFLKRVDVWACGYCDKVVQEDPKGSDCPACGGQLERKSVVA